MLRGHPWVVFRSRAPSRQHSSFGPISLSRALSNSVSDCEKGRLAGHVLLDSMEPCRPIPQLLEPVHHTHALAIPARRYFRPISPVLLSYYSLVYSEYRHASDARLSSWCFDCQTYHTPQRLCLPDCPSDAVDLLLDFLEQTPQPLTSLGLLLDVLHLCGYLAISSCAVSHIAISSTFLYWCPCVKPCMTTAPTYSAWLFV